MSRSTRRNFSALLVVVILALVPASAVQARTLSRSTSTDVYGSNDLRGFIHHLWKGLFSLIGRDGAQADPNGAPKH
jgi:hypothetical protein